MLISHLHYNALAGRDEPGISTGDAVHRIGAIGNASRFPISEPPVKRCDCPFDDRSTIAGDAKLDIADPQPGGCNGIEGCPTA